MMLRRALWWTSLALSTTGWVLLSPLYVQFPTWIGCLLLGAAGLTAAIAASANRQDTAKSWIGAPLAIAVALASAVAAIVLPWGMRTALAMLTCGVVAVAAVPHYRLSRGTGSGLLAAVTTMAMPGTVSCSHSSDSRMTSTCRPVTSSAQPVLSSGTLIAAWHTRVTLAVTTTGCCRIPPYRPAPIMLSLKVPTATGSTVPIPMPRAS